MRQTITYKSLKSQRRFGIEVELNQSLKKTSIIKAIEDYSNYKVRSFSYGKSINNKLWHVKKDGSCGDDDDEYGWEVASFVGRGPQDIIHMGNVVTGLKEIGAKVNNNCGLHIHAEAIDFTPAQVGVLLAYWIKIEDIIKCAISPKRDLGYCYPLALILEELMGRNFRSNKYSSLAIYHHFTHIDDDDEIDENELRFRALNVSNYHNCTISGSRKRKTLELRFPESTLEDNDVIGWLRLYLNFIEHTKTAPMPQDLYVCNLETAMTYLGLHHDENNFYLFGPSLNKTRIWFLNKLIYRLQNSTKLSNVILRKDAKKLLKKIKF